MKAIELIKKLVDLQSNAEVYVWIDGERHEILELDLWDKDHLDINCATRSE